jgi:hypothetical protein
MAVKANDSARPAGAAPDRRRPGAVVRVDRRTVARLCKRGQLPRPLKIGGGNRWRSGDIADAIDALRHRHCRVDRPAEEPVPVG